MCTYCFCADWMFKYVPYGPWNPQPGHPWTPWNPYPNPTGPAPTTPPFPITPGPVPYPWSQQQLNEALEILRTIKEMEDKLGGCPCEDASKMDFLKDIQKKIDEQGKADGEPEGDPNPVTS